MQKSEFHTVFWEVQNSTAYMKKRQYGLSSETKRRGWSDGLLVKSTDLPEDLGLILSTHIVVHNHP